MCLATLDTRKKRHSLCSQKGHSLVETSKETISTQAMHITSVGKSKMFVRWVRGDITQLTAGTGGSSESKLRGAGNACTAPCSLLFQSHLLPLAPFLLHNSDIPSGHNMLSQVSKLRHINFPLPGISSLTSSQKSTSSSSIYPSVHLSTVPAVKLSRRAPGPERSAPSPVEKAQLCSLTVLS